MTGAIELFEPLFKLIPAKEASPPRDEFNCFPSDCCKIKVTEEV